MKKIYAFFTFTAVCFCLAFTAAAKTSHYSDTLISTKGSSKNAISIGSRRASGEIYLRVHLPISSGATLTIKNAEGALVVQKTLQPNGNNQPILIENLEDLPEGEFEVVLLLKDRAYSASFIVWK